MIRDVEGDILLSKAQVIAHGIAPQDHFDSGLALALREHWPAMVKDYRHYMHSHPKDPGEIWAWHGKDDKGAPIHIVNLLTQDMLHGRTGKPGKATLENVGQALKALAKHVQAENVKSVALPRLATGVGGLEWADVKPLVDLYLGDLKDVQVIVYETFHKGQQADEKLA